MSADGLQFKVTKLGGRGGGGAEKQNGKDSMYIAKSDPFLLTLEVIKMIIQ